MGRSSRGPDVNPHAVNEVVHSAIDGIDGHPDNRAPVNPVGRTAIHNVVGGATAFVAAVRPRYIHFARAIDGRGRKAGAAKPTVLPVAGSAGNANGRVPTLASVGRGEGRHAAVVVTKSYDDSAIGLHHRIHPDTVVE